MYLTFPHLWKVMDALYTIFNASLLFFLSFILNFYTHLCLKTFEILSTTTKKWVLTCTSRKLTLNGSTMLLAAVIHNISGWNVTHAFPDQDYCRHASLLVPLLLHNEYLYSTVQIKVKSWFQEDSRGSHTTLLQWSLNSTFWMIMCSSMFLDADGRSFALLALSPNLQMLFCKAIHKETCWISKKLYMKYCKTSQFKFCTLFQQDDILNMFIVKSQCSYAQKEMHIH